MKWLLKEKKLEMLVDPDMHTEAQLEQLIQVSSPLQRPMMSDFVRMLEDDQLMYTICDCTAVVNANGNAHHNLVQNANVQDNLVQNANVQQNFEAMLQHDENVAVQEEEDEDAEMLAFIQLIEDTLSEDDEAGVHGEDMIMEHAENIAVVNGEDIYDHGTCVRLYSFTPFLLSVTYTKQRIRNLKLYFMELCNTLMIENVNMQDIADGVAAEIDGAAV
uniref:Uncharacterized protein n=1 Tax=Brassica oleracea var. oleracea TaxID=109376 RepID=A0A0D3CI38_BRAOL